MPSFPALLGSTRTPSVVFSPIKSAPRVCDERPDKIAVWGDGIGANGESFDLPSGSLVTSHATTGFRRRHYALVCRSALPFSSRQMNDEVDFHSLVNLKSGNPLGPSQVTAIVRRVQRSASKSLNYPIAFIADLVAPYFVEFRRSQIVDVKDRPISDAMREAWEVRSSFDELSISSRQTELGLFA